MADVSSSSSPQTHEPTLSHNVNQEPEDDDDDNNNNNDVMNRENKDDDDNNQLSLLALLLALFRKSFWVGSHSAVAQETGMEIGWPTDVRHVAHVTFDRFNGFLGLPDELEPEVPRRAPSASYLYGLI
ncbi:putative Rho GTPase-activating protein 1-5 [Helianthus annuus]|nr:putative Rho GTPase-activating protein 1-5 [Helianthus annuus]